MTGITVNFMFQDFLVLLNFSSFIEFFSQSLTGGFSLDI